MKKKKHPKKAAKRQVKRAKKAAQAKPKRPVRKQAKRPVKSPSKNAKPKTATKAAKGASVAPMEIPKDLRIALEGEGVLAMFESLTPGKQRTYIRRVESAKLMQGRLRSIEATVEAMQRLYYDGFRR